MFRRARKPLLAAVLGCGLAVGALAQDAPFGGPEDTAFADDLWEVMIEIGLAGENAIETVPYEGLEPHGFVLETFYATATVGGETGGLVVKRNYGPAGVSVEEVQNDRAMHLAAVTVMFKRDGYDPDNKDWFWVKYLPDGSLDKNPMGVELAGRVAKGADQGCIACHSAAPGDDFIFTRPNFMRMVVN